jgi:hypothetical protein
MKDKKIAKVCKYCGSSNVVKNADTAWNVDNQEWEIVALFNNEDCNECEGETTIKDIELD